jgi:uncharacterized membrane protein
MNNYMGNSTQLSKQLVMYVSLILLLLITGVFWGTWFTLTRSIDDFSASEFIHIGKVIILNVKYPMAFLMPSCLLLMVISLIQYPSKKSINFYVGVASFILLIVTLLITVLVEVPIDNMIKTWSAANLPQSWESIRIKWQMFHLYRTLTSIMSFISYLFFAFIKLK